MVGTAVLDLKEWIYEGLSSDYPVVFGVLLFA